MWQYNYTYPSELCHHGILGQKWGKRNGPPYPLGTSDHSASEKRAGWKKSLDKDGSKSKHSLNAVKNDYFEESGKKIKICSDGSKVIPKGFVFNRVGKSSADVNKSGGLYVSYGKDDASRYIKSLGPTLIGKLMGTSGEAVQHIKVKQNLRMPSDSVVAKEIADLLSNDKGALDNLNHSIYRLLCNDDWDKDIDQSYLKKASDNPASKDAQKLSYAVSSLLADPNYADTAASIYQHFRGKGYDAIPDVHDRLSGTSQTALIVINPDKVKITSTTTITKDVMKSAKQYVKSIGKLKVSELVT